MFLIRQKQDEDAQVQFQTLSSVVYSVQADLGEGTERFAQYLNYAQDFYRELSQTHLHEVKVVEGRMTQWKEFPFPKDMVDWCKLGVRCGDMIKTFTYDNNIPLAKDKDAHGIPQEFAECEPIDRVDVYSDVFFGVFPIYHTENFLYEAKYFGRTVQRNYLGYFRPDYQKKCFVFRDTVDKYKDIYLEYVSDGIEPTRSTVVATPALFNLLKAHVKFQRVFNNDRYSVVEKRFFKEELNEAQMTYDLSELDITIDDIRQYTRYGYTLVPQN